MSDSKKNASRYPGSRWWKFDFHTHTPKSKDFGRNDKSQKDISPEEWLKKAMQSNLDCVAITDHNSGEWIDALNKKNTELEESDNKPEWFNKLIIFPGVEITVGESGSGIHLLAVFDPKSAKEKVTGVLGACGITEQHGDPKTYTNTSFIGTVKKIKEHKGIAIPAHVDCIRGLLKGKETLSSQLKESLKSVFVAEFRNLPVDNDMDSELKMEVDRLAKVRGSDSHTIEEIGRRFSWIKMSEPSIDDLRGALVDHKYSVKNQSENPNDSLPNVFLSKLTIEKMAHCGRINKKPFLMKFSPRFNSIIGGRGTGKTTVIESIRIVTRRDKGLEKEAPRVKDELIKFMESTQKSGVMLDGTEIKLELNRHDKKFQIRWRYNGEGNVLEKICDSSQEKEDPINLKERFPISIFSQKHINELSSKPRGLMRVIDRSSEVNITDWKGKSRKVRNKFLQLREQKRSLLLQLDERRKLQVKLGDINNDINTFEEKGYAEILNNYQRYNQQKNAFYEDSVFDSLSLNIRALVSEFQPADFPVHLFTESDEITNEVKRICEKINLEYEGIMESLKSVASRIDELKNKRTRKINGSKWYKLLEESDLRYKELVDRYKEKPNMLDLSTYGKWVQDRNDMQLKLRSLDHIETNIDSIESQIEQTLIELEALRDELFDKRKNFISKVTKNNEFVSMELVQFGDESNVEADYRNILGIENGFRSNIYEDNGSEQPILNRLINMNDNDKNELPLIKENLKNIKAITREIAVGTYTDVDRRYQRHLGKKLKSDPEIFDKLDAWWPEDKLIVKYRPQGSKKFQSLEKGSAGQKAAAILAFLLNHGDEPLIIDQPEDDLDNALIYDLVVKQLQENKSKRQIIIATHNPNIVVNGDSELVHVFEFKNGQVQTKRQGGLVDKIIRENICSILEGGKEALEKRYNRITLNTT